MYYGMRGSGIKFRTVGPGAPTDVAGKFNYGTLHSQAYSQERYLVPPGIPGGGNLAFDSPLAKTSRNQDSIDSGQ
ncbi:hypothetical protein SDC9_197987 [bioreactor metagenome]|uniref:Uncharacterized protein n=1 Tax=bioreactor metagenome TaxID=1076179 RepID=A0A645IGC7_9ZZZZ